MLMIQRQMLNWNAAPTSAPSSTASSSSLKPYNPAAPDFLAPDVPDFLPHSYNGASSVSLELPFSPPLLLFS